jgi:hypothetical protein
MHKDYGARQNLRRMKRRRVTNFDGRHDPEGMMRTRRRCVLVRIEHWNLWRHRALGVPAPRQMHGLQRATGLSQFCITVLYSAKCEVSYT